MGCSGVMLGISSTRALTFPFLNQKLVLLRKPVSKVPKLKPKSGKTEVGQQTFAVAFFST
jgi:hypothetical protein